MKWDDISGPGEGSSTAGVDKAKERRRWLEKLHEV